jgi:parallel beta-helix repeat protein
MVMAFALTLGVFFSASASSASVPQMAGNTYYVAVTGSDLNNCTQAAPCKSFNKAMSLVQAGDVISVMPGTYNQSLVISKSGITVIGNGAVIDTTAQNGIKVASTAQNVNVQGFVVTGTWSHSIFVEGKFVTIENNVVHHSILENGSLSNGVITCGDGSWGSGIKAERGSSNVVFRNNTVYETCGEGIAATMSQNVVIEGNTVYDNKQVNIYIDNSSNVQVLNNLSYCTGKVNNPMGIALGEEYYSGWGAQLRDVTIAGNTVEKCSTGIMAFGSDVGGTLTNILIDRNTVPSGTSFAISIDNGTCSNVTISNNLVWKTNIWVRCSGVQLINNTLSTSSPTPPIIFTPTATQTSTPTAIIPTATNTSTPEPALPTATATASIPPTLVPSATSLPASPVPTSTDVVLAPSEKIFDDKHAGFAYSPGWEDVRLKKAHDGTYKVTLRDGAFVTFPFTGQSFSILYISGVDFRTIEVYVDDVLAGTINDKRKGNAFQQRWDYPGVLTAGAHTLKLVAVNGNGTFDAVVVR